MRNSSFCFSSFIMGISVGLFIIMVTVVTVPGSVVVIARQALEECEKDLPRNEQCELTAIKEK